MARLFCAVPVIHLPISGNSRQSSVTGILLLSMTFYKLSTPRVSTAGLKHTDQLFELG